MKHKVLFQTIKKRLLSILYIKKDIYDQCNIRKTIKLNVYLFYVAGFFFFSFFIWNCMFVFCWNTLLYICKCILHLKDISKTKLLIEYTEIRFSFFSFLFCFCADTLPFRYSIYYTSMIMQFLAID